jgi:uncharacterized protein
MQTEILLASVSFLAGAISGATGFGFALVATALWSQAFEPQRVTWFALIYMLALNLAYLPVFWRSIPWARLLPFVLGCLPGVPLGAWALAALPAQTTRMMIGATLLTYGLYMLWRRNDITPLKMSPRASWSADCCVGFFAGVLGGLASLSGFLPTLWYAWRSNDKLLTRSLVQGFILISGLWALLWINHITHPDAQSWRQLLWGLPFVAAGGALGLYVFSRLNAAQFMRMVQWVLVLCGALMIVRS